jgi:hypothetical protein
LYFLETRADTSGSPLRFDFTPAVADAQRFDATQILPTTGLSAWSLIVEDMRRHPSQFDEQWLAAIESVDPERQAVFLAPAEQALARDILPCR